MTSPLKTDANARMAAARASETQGRLLAAYASIRSTARVSDALVGFGLPLVAYVLDSMPDDPIRVTAVRGQHSAHNPLLGLGTDVEVWTLLIRCGSDVTITLDVAAGPWTTGIGPLELRVEWMRSDRVTTFHPRGAMARSSDLADSSLGLTGIEERLVDYAMDLCDLVADDIVPDELTVAMQIVEAARTSADLAVPVDLAPSPGTRHGR